MGGNYYKDNPKISENEDILDYKGFTNQIFSYIELFLKNKEGGIIGITGGWGDGKTTEINFIKERIKKYISLNKNNFKINFKYLFVQFFKLIILAAIFLAFIFLILTTIFTLKKDFLWFLWALFIFVFLIAKNIFQIVDSVKKFFKAAFLETEYIMIDFNPWFCKDENQVIEEFFKILSEKIDIQFLTSDIEQYCSGILKDKKIYFDIFSKNNSLKSLYDRIKKMLLKSNKKIIVIIDDIDRLKGCEIYNLLKLIKVTADFPNVLYILSYNKAYVTEELTDIIKYNAQEYLEKIIPNEYRLPNIKTETLKDILIKQLDYHIVNKDNYNRQGIESFFEDYLSSYIVNLRKMYKVLNAFCFQYDVFKKAGIIINIEDLLYLSVLKVSNLNLYNEIWNEKNNILNYKNYPYFDEEKQKEYREKYIIGNIERNKLSKMEAQIINHLFNKDEKYDIKRLKDRNHFDLYFKYNLQKSQIADIIKYLEGYPENKNLRPEIYNNETLISDINDIMYSNFYFEKRDMNFIFAIFNLFIKIPLLAKELYSYSHRNYFSINEKYIKNYDEEKTAEFINENKEEFEINLLEWLLSDTLAFHEKSGKMDALCELPPKLDNIRKEIIQTIKNKLINCDLSDIYYVQTLYRFVYLYKFDEIIKDKFLKYLEKTDEEVLDMLLHFTSAGVSNTGEFLNLYDIELIQKLGILKEYKERLLKIKENTEIMENKKYINRYSSSKEFSDDNKKHIIDKSLELIDKLS